MNLEFFRTYCLAKKGATESLPFGEDTLVFKVGNKIFALTDFESQPMSFNVKCDPEMAAELRAQYPCVQPGYHMNTKHWNTIIADGSVTDQQLQQWIDHSYELVVKSLTKAQQQELGEVE